MNTELLIQAAYLAACVLFILGLRGLTRPETARRGMQFAAVGMLLAIAGTLVHHQIIEYRWIVGGLVIGAIIGYPLGMWVPMTAMPQRIAASLSFGALAATLVGVAEYYTSLHPHVTGAVSSLARGARGGTLDGLPTFKMGAIAFEVMLGAIAVTGSFMAFGKLQGFVPERPITYRGQNAMNALLAAALLTMLVLITANPSWQSLFYLMVATAAVLGVSFVLPIGGADMPVVITLLNSYSGLAASATGFAIGNNVLIVAGALDGASGFILSILMSKAMNRSFRNVLFGAFGGSTAAAGGSRTAEGLSVRSVSAEDAAVQLAYARKVIVVPGYGMAVAQSQHQVRELAELIEKKGGEVKYAIHPVAGRMPGHMNVLLAEANIPYDRLYDMDEINEDFREADVALVIGANDVVNPAARTDAASPIYGMPILNADQARSVIVLKRGMSAGFAGIENDLFYDPRTSMLFGDAKTSLNKLIAEVKTL